MALPAAARDAAPPRRTLLRGWMDVAIATWKDAGENHLDLVSAGVAFYAFFAFVPLLSAFVLSYGLFADPADVVHHVETLTTMMPENAAEIVGDQLRSMTESSDARTGLALCIALVIALYGASKGTGAIINALNIVFRSEETRGFFGRTLVALTMTGGAVVVLFLAILAVSALNFLESLLPQLGGLTIHLIKFASFLLAAGSVILLLAVVYRFGPNRPDKRWRWITPGSALATLAWLAATAGFGFYVSSFASYNATYGSLGAIIVFLTWLYLTAYIVLLGAELNAVMERRAGRETPEGPDQPDGAGRAFLSPEGSEPV